MPEIHISVPRPHAAQQEIWLARKRFNVVCNGRRFGKTKLGVYAVIQAMKMGMPVGWFAPTFQILMDAWREMRSRLADITIERSEQHKRIVIHNGGSLECWSTDDPDAGRSRRYARVIIDEAAMVRRLEETWNAAIRPTLTDLAGDAWFPSTPKGLNYFHTLYQRGGVEEGWAAWQMPTARNPYIPAGEIEAARRDLPSLVFQQEYLAQFVTFEGTAVRREWLKVATAPPTCRRFVMGVDLAISTKTSADWTAAIVLTMDDAGRIYLVAAERTRAPFNEILAFVQAMADRWHPVQIGIEDVQFQAAVVQELLRTTSLPVRGVRPDRDKLTRFQPVAARYEQGLIYHDPDLPTTFENELLAFPQGEHDDWVDALAYAFNLLRAAPFEYATADRRGDDWRGRRGY